MATKITKEEVIEKLRDDGDFDRLRLQIIRRLKENEELRSNLISVVKQSAALNRPGAETMKPRQLSDAIFEEVGSKMMSQLSDGLWGIIRSEDGMKNEITETVLSVYNRLLHPGEEEDDEKGTTSTSNTACVEKVTNKNRPVRVITGEDDVSVSDKEPNEPPGFTLPNNHHLDSNGQQHGELGQASGCVKGTLEEKKEEESHHQPVVTETNEITNGLKACVGDSDDDPEVPPGFG